MFGTTATHSMHTGSVTRSNGMKIVQYIHNRTIYETTSYLSSHGLDGSPNLLYNNNITISYYLNLLQPCAILTVVV